ncbi:MAG: hypothetical protein HQM13_23285 [SAR324 cluster bacterium]|nr:hypothetical protein [SAR324 cluster bacterium]
MKRPFNLVLTFSIASLISIVILMIGLSWLLGKQLESRLLARDQLLIGTVIQEEVNEHLARNLPFETVYKDPEFLDDMLEATMEIPGTRGLEILDTSGKVLWSTDPERLGTERKTDLLSQVLEGKSVIEFRDDDHSEASSVDWKFDTGLYVPIVQNQQVIGVFEIHRNNARLKQQVESLKSEVRFYCAIFGLGLYFVLMAIIVPASRILQSQYKQLSSTAKTLKDVNEELKLTQRELLQKERLSAIGEVCGAVAHGLKNPVSSVRSAVQLLGAISLSAGEREEITQEILQEVDRLTKRLNDLLNFIRPFELNLQYAQLTDILKNAVRDLKWKAREEQITLSTEFPDGVESIQIDASLITEAILIVLSNAMDASSNGQTVTCRLVSDEDCQLVLITDQGKGISEEVLPHVFDCFFTTRSQGVGLGLALCKKIIELHRGRVSIESGENKGTTVRLEIPVVREIAESPAL